jgi:adenylate cyclase
MSDISSVLSRDDMLALIESGQELSAQITLDTLLQNILAKASHLTDSPDTSIILQHEEPEVNRFKEGKKDADEEGWLYVAAATGDNATWLETTFGKHSAKAIPIKGSKAGKVLTTGKSIVENKVEGHFKGVDEETGKPTESMVCVPLGVGSGAMGVMQILNKPRNNYDDHDRVLLELFASQAAVAIKNAQLFKSVLAHSGFFTRFTGTDRLVEITRDLRRPAHLETLTILFADMRGFTQLCHSIGSPVSIQKQLNQFISMLTEEVIVHDGMVNKFLGDGLMALFRSENHAERAVKTAFEIVDRFGEMKAKWNDKSSEQLDFLDIGIGIVTGEVTIGGIGTETVRDFTAIGSAVNLAAAFENGARDGKRIIVNHITYAAVKDGVEAESLGDFVLKKAKQTVGIKHKRYSLKKLDSLHAQKIFISHSHGDRQLVEEKIVQPLKHLGVKTWYALTDVRQGSVWTAEIRKGLEECTSMVVVVSKNSSGSKWVRIEVDLAFSMDRMLDKIVPLLLDETAPETVNSYLLARQGIDVRATPNVAEEILRFIRGAIKR